MSIRCLLYLELEVSVKTYLFCVEKEEVTKGGYHNSGMCLTVVSYIFEAHLEFLSEACAALYTFIQ